LHKIFLNWILSQSEYWRNKGIFIEEIIDKIDNTENPNFPFVSVHHTSEYAMGQISLHKIYEGYIVDFEVYKIETEKPLFYHFEFSTDPLFDLWQERYIEFFCSK
jgi:hypothetical protein